ncbi:MAG: NfeD family protein [Maritimibacter sp.]
MLWEIWWVWVAAAFALAILEVLIPAFFFVGFAFGALIVGLLMAVGVSLTLPWALVIFAVTSVLSWLAARKVMGERMGQKKEFNHDINED